MIRSLKTIGFAVLFTMSVGMLTQCAPGAHGLRRAPSRVFVGPSEPLLLRTMPFDTVLAAELRRGGVDPVAFEQEFTSELRYRFFLRKQEEAQDSVSARVILSISVKHLQPGTGASGTFAVFEVASNRGGVSERTEWTLRKPSKANVPPVHLARDLSRAAVNDILDRIPAAKPRPKEPPPPLILFQ
jgi:hypothetical protein